MWPTDVDLKPPLPPETEPLTRELAEVAEATSPLDRVLKLSLFQPSGPLRMSCIAVTLGKATYDVKSMEKLLGAGMNIAILNMTFGLVEDHLNAIRMLKQAVKNYSARMGQPYPLALALRLSGRKLRTGRIAQMYGDTVDLKTGDTVKITTDETYKDRCSMNTVYVDFLNFAEQMKKKDLLLVDNELIALRVESIFGSTVTCRIERGGLLGSYKDIFPVNKHMVMPNFTERDKQDIEMGIRHQIDIIIVLFVSSSRIIEELRKMLGSKAKKISIIANVQNFEGYDNYDEILSVSDGIMITRQELGNDIYPEKLVIAQKNMIARANMANVPVYVCAHILSTMRFNQIAMRSEMLDIANLVLDGVDTFVLAAETAIGAYPIESVKCLHDACKEAEACVWTQQIFCDWIDKTPIPSNETTCTAMSAVLAALKCRAAAIVVITKSGKSAKLLSKFKPRCPVIAVTRFASVARQLHMWWGILPLLYETTSQSRWHDEMDARIRHAIKWGIGLGFIRVGNYIVVLSSWHQKLENNTLRIIRAE